MAEKSCLLCHRYYTSTGQNQKYCSKSCQKRGYREYAVTYAKTWVSENRVKVLLKAAKHRAKIKGIPFSITDQDILIPEFCPVLNIPLVSGSRCGSGGKSNSPSLDRLDNEKGYVPGNVWVISHKANTMKGAASWDQLVKFAEWVLNTYVKQG